MKITGLQTFVVAVGETGGGNWVFVKVHTDQDGLDRPGRGHGDQQGPDDRRRHRGARALPGGARPAGHRVAVAGDVPLPPLAGRPGPQLRHLGHRDGPLGHQGQGPRRPRLAAPGRGGARPHPAATPTPRPHSEGGLRRIEELVKLGYTAIKSGPFTVKDDVVHPTRDVREGAAAIHRMREVVGEDVDILIDAHGLLTPTMAVDFARRVEGARPMWIEEITQPEDLATLAWVAERSPVPAGHRRAPVHQVGLQRPDPAARRGLHPAGRLPRRRHPGDEEDRRHGRGEVPRGGPPRGLLRGARPRPTSTSTPAPPTAPSRSTPWAAPGATRWCRPPARCKDGYAALPQAPGLGVELDEAEAAKHPYRAGLPLPVHLRRRLRRRRLTPGAPLYLVHFYGSERRVMRYAKWW